MSDFTVDIRGHTLEYFDKDHVYLVNGVMVPSVTQILKKQFGRKYAFVDEDTLRRASEAGTAVHGAIENYCKHGEVRDLKELRNFLFLQKHYQFEVIESEVPVILFKDWKPVCAGRLDLVLEMGGEIGGADIKRTSVLDKWYLAYQLNIYRIAYWQCYGAEWKFLRGVHLKDDTRKFVKIPIAEDLAWKLVDKYLEEA